MPESRFELLGHDNPFGVYPAPVVAVGRLDEALVAVYAGEKAQEPVAIDEEATFVEHGDGHGRDLGGFDFRRHRLFAFSAGRVVYYSIDEEEEFFSRLLDSETLRQEDPFLRLSLAKATGSREAIRAEMRTCLIELKEQAPFLIDSWYESQRKQLGAQLKAALPKDWQGVLAARKRSAKAPSPKPVAGGLKYNVGERAARPMARSAVVEHFAEKFELKRAQVKELFEELANLATSEVRRNGEFVLPGFGKLVLSRPKVRAGRNPQTGESIQVPARTALRFRLSKNMKDAVVPKRK